MREWIYMLTLSLGRTSSITMVSDAALAVRRTLTATASETMWQARDLVDATGRNRNPDRRAEEAEDAAE